MTSTLLTNPEARAILETRADEFERVAEALRARTEATCKVPTAWLAAYMDGHANVCRGLAQMIPAKVDALVFDQDALGEIVAARRYS